MEDAELAATDAANRKAVAHKLMHALANDTPSRPRRPEVEAVSLARDIVSHSIVKRRLPLVIEDNTRLTGGSSITLGDGKRQVAVVVCVHVPPATHGAALQARLEAASQLAEARAAALALPEDSAVAYGVASNAAGLVWTVQPAGWSPVISLPAACAGSMESKEICRGVWRWTAAAAAAVAAWLGMRR